MNLSNDNLSGNYGMNTQFGSLIAGIDYQTAIAVIGILMLLILATNLFLLTHQMKKQHDWNRRKEAQDLIGQMIKGEIYETRKVLEKYVNFWDPYENYLTVANDGNRAELDFNLKIYLSYFEGIALGVKHNVYDNEIVYDYLGSVVPEVYRWARGYIDNLRNEAEDPTLFIEMALLAEQWGLKNKYHKMKVIKDLQTKG